MAKRPAFNLPSTKKASAGKTDWVYRSDDEAPAVAASTAETSMSDEASVPVSEADRIIARYSKWAAAAGVVPVPLFDLVAIGSVQLRMIGALATHYNLAFDRQLAKGMLASAAASMGATGIGFRAGRSLLKAIPGVGSATAIVAMPLTAYAITTALGKMFSTHFANGGTLFDKEIKTATT